MIIISHRGNIRGPIPDKENRPSYTDCAIGNGYHVEIDVRSINGELWLGHDEPQYKTTAFFLNRTSLWCHAKNVEALHHMLLEGIHCFWHEEDAYTVTSNGWIWAYPGQPGTKMAIAVMPESDQDLSNYQGVCSDYPSRYQ